MDYAVSVLMFCFAGMILLYAAALAVFKDANMIPYSQMAKIEKPKAYAVQFAKVMFLVAMAPALGGVVGLLFGNGAALITSLAALAVFIWLGSKMMPWG